MENLCKIEHKSDYDVLTILNRKFVVGSLETKDSTASKTGLNRYNFYTPFPNKCLVCILTENDGIRNTEPALETFDKNGFKANNAIGTGQFFCTAIGY